MRRACVLLFAVPLLIAGCDSDPEVVVRATLAGQDGGIAELPVRLLPYNRDSIIAGLEDKAKTPQPQVPPELLAQIDSLQKPRAARAGDTLAAVRERSLRTLRARVDSIQEARREWSTKTLAGFNEAVTKKLGTLGDMEELADTTDAAGSVTFRAPPGQWWVYSRYLLPNQELYWNVPVEIGSGTTAVQLNERNAKARPAP